PNGAGGIQLSSASSSNTFGGTVSGAGNVISGNHQSGIVINSGGGNIIAGNFIGTNAAGTAALGNDQFGVEVGNGTHDNTIGGSTSGARNIISGNHADGVLILFDGPTHNTIQGNYIGTDATGAVALGNAGVGVGLIGTTNNT